MRGIPNHKVRCSKCGSIEGCQKDQLCHACRIKSRPSPNKRFFWTPDLDQALTRAYQEARSREELTDNLDHIGRRTGFTRIVILSRAAALGLGSRRRRWTKEEAQQLAEWAGTLSNAVIARKLGRSYCSVKREVCRLGLSARITEGYSQTEVMGLLGTSARMPRKWISMGWLRLHDNRVTEASMIKFLREHPEEYSLNRVDEAWFKGLLFPAFGRKSFEGDSRTAARRSLAQADLSLATDSY
ncbi:MAG: hypothetical protein JWM83_1458 [Candidatus Angelobacter sp.]|nr:hypothetical protein [Candidatus Angelobacter sp.]